MATQRSDRTRAARTSAPAPKRSPAAPAPVPGALALQQGAGNRAVVGLLAQAKLAVGSVDDPLEAEADRVADAVVQAMRAPVPSSSPPAETHRRVARVAQRLAAGPAVGPDGGEVDPEVESSLNSARGGGRPVPDGVRRQMEDATGADFGSVRLHEGPLAQSLNERLGAKAFTVGGDIFFRSGIPDTNSREGQHLLGHELAHTVQQGASAQRTT